MLCSLRGFTTGKGQFRTRKPSKCRVSLGDIDTLPHGEGLTTSIYLSGPLSTGRSARTIGCSPWRVGDAHRPVVRRLSSPWAWPCHLGQPRGCFQRRHSPAGEHGEAHARRLGVRARFESCSAMHRAAQVNREDEEDLVRRSMRFLAAFQIRCNYSRYGLYQIPADR